MAGGAIVAVAFTVADDVAVLVALVSAVAVAAALAVAVTTAVAVLLLPPSWRAGRGMRVSNHHMYGGKAEWLLPCALLWLLL